MPIPKYSTSRKLFGFCILFSRGRTCQSRQESPPPLVRPGVLPSVIRAELQFILRVGVYQILIDRRSRGGSGEDDHRGGTEATFGWWWSYVTMGDGIRDGC